MHVLEVETDIRVTLRGWGKKRHKATLLMLLNCIKKISTTKTNEKEQKTTMNHVYEQKKHKK